SPNPCSVAVRSGMCAAMEWFIDWHREDTCSRWNSPPRRQRSFLKRCCRCWRVPMRTPEERRIEAWGLPLAGRFWPGEGTPILALHGGLDNANSFLPLAAHLGQPLFALDFAGHGKSAARPLNTAIHYIDNVRDVLAAADALGWQRFVLLGHSMGAGVASLF